MTADELYKFTHEIQELLPGIKVIQNKKQGFLDPDLVLSFYREDQHYQLELQPKVWVGIADCPFGTKMWLGLHQQSAYVLGRFFNRVQRNQILKIGQGQELVAFTDEHRLLEKLAKEKSFQEALIRFYFTSGLGIYIHLGRDYDKTEEVPLRAPILKVATVRTTSLVAKEAAQCLQQLITIQKAFALVQHLGRLKPFQLPA